jgi:hypothetical protein
MNNATGLDIVGLETAYDQLAMAIDAAGTEKSELFLVKLALLAAQALGDASTFVDLIERAQKDL